MNSISLVIMLTDSLGVNGVVIDHNDTNLPSDSDLVELVCIALLKSIALNKEDLSIQDLLNELDIKTEQQKKDV